MKRYDCYFVGAMGAKIMALEKERVFPRSPRGRHPSIFEIRPRENPAGTKLIKCFIKTATRENYLYRADLLRMTGETLP